MYTLKKVRFKITQLEKVRFIKVDEIITIQVELFLFFFILSVYLLKHQNCFAWPIQKVLNVFYTIITFHFKYHHNVKENKISSDSEIFL